MSKKPFVIDKHILEDHRHTSRPMEYCLYLLSEEYKEAWESNFGYCSSCGVINENFHDSGAKNCKCGHCGQKTSKELSEALKAEELIIVDSKEFCGRKSRW